MLILCWPETPSTQQTRTQATKNDTINCTGLGECLWIIRESICINKSNGWKSSEAEASRTHFKWPIEMFVFGKYTIWFMPTLQSIWAIIHETGGSGAYDFGAPFCHSMIIMMIGFLCLLGPIRIGSLRILPCQIVWAFHVEKIEFPRCLFFGLHLTSAQGIMMAKGPQLGGTTFSH